MAVEQVHAPSKIAPPSSSLLTKLGGIGEPARFCPLHFYATALHIICQTCWHAIPATFFSCCRAGALGGSSAAVPVPAAAQPEAAVAISFPQPQAFDTVGSRSGFRLGTS